MLLDLPASVRLGIHSTETPASPLSLVFQTFRDLFRTSPVMRFTRDRKHHFIALHLSETFRETIRHGLYS